jgi:DNA-binding SARP family transcriptional activator
MIAVPALGRQRGLEAVQSALALLWLLGEIGQIPSIPARRRIHSRASGATAAERRRRSTSLRAVQGPVGSACEPVTGLAIRCFGRFEVFRDGKPIQDWQRGKARSLLKFLVTERHPVPRDVLTELLWPQYAVEPARNNLRVTLHALRQALGQTDARKSVEPDYISCVDGHFALDGGCELWIDVDAFDAEFAMAFRLERQGRVAAAMRAYEQAEALYRDDYLVEDLYEDWAGARRERLKDQYLLAVTNLADYSLKQGDAFGCIVRCHKILEKDVCREDAYVRLMRCYDALGQRARALHWYDVCARTLRKELDLEPSDATNQLVAQIRAGRDQAYGLLPAASSSTMGMSASHLGEEEIECRGGSGERPRMHPGKQRG